MSRLLQHWITTHAHARPEATALVLNGAHVTYGQWEAGSNSLARLLRESGCQRGDRVALLAPKSLMALVALVGVYKADAICVPLDPASPAPRLQRILDSCRQTWLLGAGQVAPILEELRHLNDGRPFKVGVLDRTLETSGISADFGPDDVVRSSPASLAYRNGPHDPAHILFTSGSTGQPKGVVITHGGVCHFVDWAAPYFGLNASDRVSQHAPLHFDLSFFDIFGAASVGAQIHLVPPSSNVFAKELAAFIRESALTQWFSAPSFLTYMARFDVITQDDFPHLRRVLWAGEVFPTTGLIYWMTRLPHVTFTNLYGPTETTIASCFYTVPSRPKDPLAPIPIGRPCDGEELLVLDDGMQPVPVGRPGELCIAGAGLARGYWDEPGLTASVFVRNPRRSPPERLYKTGDLARIGDDGEVYLLGRKDSQVKSRGYRIELGEIEAAVTSIGDIAESAVVAIATDGFEGVEIGCAYVPKAGHEPKPFSLRQSLAQLLPSYMLPTRWQRFDAFPISANGKVDRRRLAEAFSRGDSANAVQGA